MDAHRYSQCVPRNHDPSISEQPLIDFSSGYILRSIDKFPKQGSKAPWRLYQNYPLDVLSLKRGRIEDGVIEFTDSRSSSNPAPAIAGA